MKPKSENALLPEKDHQPENITSRKTRHQADEKGEISNKNGLENKPTKGKHLACVANKKMMLLKTEPREETEAAKQEEYKEFSKKSGLENEFPNGKLPFSRKKVNSLEIKKSGKTENKAEEKEEVLVHCRELETDEIQVILAKRRNALIPQCLNIPRK